MISIKISAWFINCGRDDQPGTEPIEETTGLMVSLSNLEVFSSSSTSGGIAAPGTSEGFDGMRGTTAGTDVENFEVEIRSLDGSGTVLSFNRLEDVPDTVFLSPGQYEVYVENRDFEGPAFGWPHYCGSQEVEIDLGQFKTVEVTAQPCNTRVKVTYSENAQNIFDNYSTTITTEDAKTLDYAQTETRFGYFKPGQSLDVSVSLERISSDGSPVTDTVTGTISDIEAGESYTILISANLDNGGLLFEVDVSENWEEIGIGFGNDKSQSNDIVKNRTVSIYPTNVIVNPGNLEETYQTIWLTTSSGEQAEHVIHFSNDINSNGPIIGTFTAGENGQFDFDLRDGGFYMNRDLFYYLKVFSTFPDGTTVVTKSSYFLSIYDQNEPANFMSIDIPQDNPQYVFNEQDEALVFVGANRLSLPILRQTSDVSDVKLLHFGSEITSVNFDGQSLNSDTEFSLEEGGIQRFSLSGRSSINSTSQLTDSFYMILLPELKPSDIVVDIIEAGVRVDVSGYNFNGEFYLKVWRANQGATEVSDAFLVSDFVANDNMVVIDQTPSKGAGEVIEYFVQVSAHSVASSATSSNIVKVSYVRPGG